jgi:MSHA biogenesis protein MshL
MKPDSPAPLYGRLVQVPRDDGAFPGEPPQQRGPWAWLMPWALVLAAVGLTLLLSACSSLPSGGPAQGLMPQIRDSLAEPSKPAPSTVPPEVSRELLPPADLSLAKLSKKAAEARFDLNVVNLPVAEVFEALARDTRYSILIEPDLKAAVTVSLKDVTLVDALETLREMYGFEYRVQGSRIFVQKAALQTRVFQINYPVTTRTGRSDIRVTSGSITQAAGAGSGTPANASSSPSQNPSSPAPTSQESSRITTQIHNELWTEIETSLKALLGLDSSHPDGHQLIVSPQSGVIVVRAMPSELRQVERYLSAMQLNVEREVMLESKIIEVTLTDTAQSGVNWSAFHAGAGARGSAGLLTPGASLSPSGALADALLSATPGVSVASPVTGTPPLFGLAFQTSNFAALMEFLQTQGNVQVLSSPRIAAMNNQKAVLKVGTDDFFVTGITTNISSSSSANGAAVITPTISVQPFFSGVALDVTPQIDDDGNIMLHVHPSVSSVAERSKVVNLGTLGNYTLPLASSTVSETDTLVRVRDGNIVAIGGLMKISRSDNRSGVPGAADLPWVGTLFRSDQHAQTKQELVILIKPSVVHSQTQLDTLREDALQRLSADTGGSKL